jgi:hypothetical protein
MKTLVLAFLLLLVPAVADAATCIATSTGCSTGCKQTSTMVAGKATKKCVPNASAKSGASGCLTKYCGPGVNRSAIVSQPAGASVAAGSRTTPSADEAKKAAEQAKKTAERARPH